MKIAGTTLSRRLAVAELCEIVLNPIEFCNSYINIKNGLADHRPSDILITVGSDYFLLPNGHKSITKLLYYYERNVYKIDKKINTCCWMPLFDLCAIYIYTGTWFEQVG